MSDAFARRMYGQRPRKGPPPGEAWEFWVKWGRKRIESGRDIIVVIDADRKAGPTRIGKSTLGQRLLMEWDPTFKRGVLRERIASRPLDLAGFVGKCGAGQGMLYDEGMWGARARDAMAPETKMLGELLGTLASRGAIVVICVHSMLSLDSEVRGLAALRMLVRRRGLAEAHTPQIQLDLERPRLLPFREHAMSPVRWDPIVGAMHREYEAVKREVQDRWLLRRLEEQRIWEARRLGLPIHPPVDRVTAGGHIRADGVPPPPPSPPQTWKCGVITFRRSDHYLRHLTSETHAKGRCGGAPGTFVRRRS